MNLAKLSWKNLSDQPLSTALSLMLFSFGVSIISLLMLLYTQVDEKLERNQAGIGLVVGAKGSPLQLVLSSVYHVDFPTGNIDMEEAMKLKKHPLVSAAIPLALGDMYQGFRIVGTTQEYPELYKAELAKGQWWAKDMQVTLGSKVAAQTGLQIGDTFAGAHGLTEEGGHAHEEHRYEVVGIMKPTGSVLDQLILTNVASVWNVHEEHGHAAAEPAATAVHEAHDHDDHEGHDHDEHAGHEHAEQPKREITSLLLKFRNPMGALTLPRMINENTQMQAASPVYETARLYELLGVGIDALKALGAAVMLISGLSVAISLYNTLKERRYEIAYMRVLGASRVQLFTMVLLEGVWVALMGYVLGIALSHAGMSVLGYYLEDAWKFDFSAWHLLPEEGYMLLASLAVGVLAALLPAWQAANTDISTTLSQES